MSLPRRLSAIFVWLAIFIGGCSHTIQLPGPLEAGWEGKSVCELLYEDDRLRVLRCTFEPGVGHERHFHKPHFGYVLAGGRMRITNVNGTRELDLATGSSYSSEEIVWHEVLNIGDTKAVFLIVEPK